MKQYNVLQLLFLVLLVNTIFAKCGINYNYYVYEDIKKESGVYHTYSGIFLSNNRFCSDMEMLDQCNDAKNKFNNFVNKIFDYYLFNNRSYEFVLPIDSKINCHDSITCYYNGREHGDFWCENMDLYDKCVTIKNNFDNYALNYSQFNSWKPTIDCMNNNYLPRLIVFRSENAILLDNIPHNPIIISGGSIVSVTLIIYILSIGLCIMMIIS